MPPDYSGPLPVYPDELSGYEFSLARNLGTLQIAPNSSSSQKDLVVRLFGDGGKARVILASATGQYISDISNFEGSAGEYPTVIDASGLADGLYYLYLIVNDNVMHLQEMQIGD
jgi:hypothetical protein